MAKKGERLSPEHLQKIKEGKARAALERQQAADATALPAGALRDEQRAINADALEERMEKRKEEAGIEAIDAAKLTREEPEIRRHLRRRERASGIPIKGTQPGFRYAWLTHGQFFGPNAKTNVSKQHADAESFGYETVQGNDPAAKEYESGAGMAGTTGRGVGDVYLAKIREDDYQDMLEEDRMNLDRQGAVEDRSVVYAQEKLGRNGLQNTMHNIADANDHFVTTRISAAQRSPIVATTQVSEGDLRRGSMRGPGGRIMQPGFERRM